MALQVERSTTHRWSPAQAVVARCESDTQHLQRWLQAQTMSTRAADIEQLSGIWKGESMPEGATTPTVWGETEMTFTRENNICRLKGAGASIWHGQSIEFRLVGTVDPATLRFEMYKTHIGTFNNTILFKGRLELNPPRLCGNSLKGTVTLVQERTNSRSSAGQDYYQQNPPEAVDTVYEHSSRTRKKSDTLDASGGTPSWTNQPLYCAMPLTPLTSQTMHLKDNSFRESIRQNADQITLEDSPIKLEGPEFAYTRVTYCDVMTPALGMFPSISDRTREPSPSRKRQEIDSPKEHQPREKDGYPTCPPETMGTLSSLSPNGNPQLYSDHSRDYEPNLRPSPHTLKTGNAATDSSNLCGVWAGASKKKTASHPMGEVTEWNDVVMYFNLKEGNVGNIRGRGESVWRSTVIPFLLEGTFDLEQATVHLRKIHVGKFNNIVSYDLVMGPPEDFLRLSLGGDDGSMELKQVQQAFDRLRLSQPHEVSPTLHPQQFQSELPIPTNIQPKTPVAGAFLGATVYTPMASNSMLPSRTPVPALPPVYTLLPRSAMEELQTERTDSRDLRVSSYCLFLSGLLVSDRLSAQQQQALTAYRTNTDITEQEHQASLRLLNLTPKEFEKKLRTRSDDLCKVCFERPIDCVILPCGHLTTCAKCSGKLERCPVCRQGIVETKRVFRS
jgi:hypothetical protein